MTTVSICENYMQKRATGQQGDILQVIIFLHFDRVVDQIANLFRSGSTYYSKLLILTQQSKVKVRLDLFFCSRHRERKKILLILEPS